MREDYVTFETAKLLKSAGFDEPTVHGYHKGGTFLDYSADYPAPHLWHAMKWLRNEKQIYIGINKWVETESVNIRGWVSKSITYYMPTLCTLDFEKWLTRCETYEQACDVGVAAACEWLCSPHE